MNKENFSDIIFLVYSVFEDFFGIVPPAGLYLVIIDDPPQNDPAIVEENQGENAQEENQRENVHEENQGENAQEENQGENAQKENLEENAQEENEQELLHPCVICLTAEADHITMACGHLVCCCACATELERMGQYECPICRSLALCFF